MFEKRPVNVYRPLFDWLLWALNCAGQCLQRDYLKIDQAFLFGIVNTVGAVRLGGVGHGLGNVVNGHGELDLAVFPRVFGFMWLDAQAVWIGQLRLDGLYAQLFSFVVFGFLRGHRDELEDYNAKQQPNHGGRHDGVFDFSHGKRFAGSFGQTDVVVQRDAVVCLTGRVAGSLVWRGIACATVG